MVSEAVVSKSAGHLTVAGLALLAGFAVGGLLAGLYGAVGVVLRLAIVAVAVLVAAKRLVLGLAVLADGILDARHGPVPSSSALDPRNPFEIPLPKREAGDRPGGSGDATEGGGVGGDAVDDGAAGGTGTDAPGDATDESNEGPSEGAGSDESDRS